MIWLLSLFSAALVFLVSRVSAWMVIAPQSPAVWRSETNNARHQSWRRPRGVYALGMADQPREARWGKQGISKRADLNKLSNEQLIRYIQEMELRIIKLDAELNQKSMDQAELRRLAANVRLASVSSAVGGMPADEQLLLGCTAAGGMMGYALGKICGQGVLGTVAGAMASVYNYNKDSRLGAFFRSVSKLVVIGIHSFLALQQEFKVQWKAWRVYERLFKEVDRIDRKFEITEKAKNINGRYQVSDVASSMWGGIADAYSAGERSVKSGVSPSFKLVSNLVESAGQGIEYQYNQTTNAWHAWHDYLAQAANVTQSFGNSWGDNWKKLPFQVSSSSTTVGNAANFTNVTVAAVGMDAGVAASHINTSSSTTNVSLAN